MNAGHWLDQVVAVFEHLHKNVGIALTAVGHDPMPSSPASEELQSKHLRHHLETAYSQGTILIEASMDHFSGFVRGVTLPVLTISPWTSVRTILETSAIARWLLDTRLDASSRASRSHQFRCEGLSQQLKFARVAGGETDLDHALDRYREVLAQADSYGLEVLHDDQGRPKCLARSMPSASDLVKDYLQQESAYRLLSAMAHGHPWALQQLAFRSAQESQPVLLEKNLGVRSIAYLGKLALDVPRAPIMDKCALFGWPSAGIAEFFDQSTLDFARAVHATSRTH